MDEVKNDSWFNSLLIFPFPTYFAFRSDVDLAAQLQLVRGQEAVMNYLLEIDLLNNVCEVCGKVVPVQYEDGSPFHRIACPTCKPKSSCTTNTALH